MKGGVEIGQQACGQRRGHINKSCLARRRHSGHAPAQAYCNRFISHHQDIEKTDKEIEYEGLKQSLKTLSAYKAAHKKGIIIIKKKIQGTENKRSDTQKEKQF